MFCPRFILALLIAGAGLTCQAQTNLFSKLKSGDEAVRREFLYTCAEQIAQTR